MKIEKIYPKGIFYNNNVDEKNLPAQWCKDTLARQRHITGKKPGHGIKNIPLSKVL